MKITAEELRGALDKYRRAPKPLSQEAQAAASELKAFLESEAGLTAIQLLAATGRHITLFQVPSEDSHYTAYLVNGKGLVTASGFESSSPVPSEPVYSAASPEGLVAVAASHDQGFDYPSLMKTLEADLRRIVDSAPRS